MTLSFLIYTAIFVFRLYCHDDSRKMYSIDPPKSIHISSTQLCRMVHDLYGQGLENNFQAHAVLKDINGGFYDFEDFIDFTGKHWYLLLPSLQLQQRLRHVVCGEQFWLTHVHREVSSDDLIPSILLVRDVQNRYPLVDFDRSLKKSIVGAGGIGWGWSWGPGSRTTSTHRIELKSHLHFQLSAICDSFCGLICRGEQAVASSASAFRMRYQSVKRLAGGENERRSMGWGQSRNDQSRSSRSLMKIRPVRVTPQSNTSFEIKTNINPISTIPGNSFAPPVVKDKDLDPYETSTMALFRALSQETSSRVLDMDWPSGGQRSFRNPTNSSTVFPSSEHNSWSESSSAHMSPVVSEKLSGKFHYRGSIPSKSRLSSNSSTSQERARTPVMSPSSSVKTKRQYHPRTSYLTSLPEIGVLFSLSLLHIWSFHSNSNDSVQTIPISLIIVPVGDADRYTLFITENEQLQTSP